MIDKRKFYINGTWINPIIKNDFEVINPSNEQPYAFISLGTTEDVDLAVNAAKKAFITWSQVSKKHKISRERVRQIETKALDKLKKSLLEISNQNKEFFI